MQCRKCVQTPKNTTRNEIERNNCWRRRFIARKREIITFFLSSAAAAPTQTKSFSIMTLNRLAIVKLCKHNFAMSDNQSSFWSMPKNCRRFKIDNRNLNGNATLSGRIENEISKAQMHLPIFAFSHQQLSSSLLPSNKRPKQSENVSREKRERERNDQMFCWFSLLLSSFLALEKCEQRKVKMKEHETEQSRNEIVWCYRNQIINWE